MEQLTAQSSAELVQAILEDGKVVPELRDLILSKAGGNPLFVEELTHNLLENGSIRKKDNQYVLTRRTQRLMSLIPFRQSLLPGWTDWRKASKGLCRWLR